MSTPQKAIFPFEYFSKATFFSLFFALTTSLSGKQYVLQYCRDWFHSNAQGLGVRGGLSPHLLVSSLLTFTPSHLLSLQMITLVEKFLRLLEQKS